MKKDYIQCKAVKVTIKDENGKDVEATRYVPVDMSKEGLRGKISAWAEDHPVASKVIKVGGLAALTGGASLLGWWARGREFSSSEPLALAAGTETVSTNDGPSEMTYSEGEA